MKPEIDPLISETIDEFSEILFSFGYKKSPARIIIFLHAAFEASYEEMCRGTGMSPCQVARGFQILKGRNLIQIRKGRKKVHGKRPNLYSLTGPIEDIIQAIDAKKKEELQMKIGRLQMLCYLLMSG